MIELLTFPITLLQKVERSVSVHEDLCNQLLEWGAKRKEYLATKEAISSLSDAEVRFSMFFFFYFYVSFSVPS